MRRYYEDDDDEFLTNTEEVEIEPEFGCGFCWDKKKNKNIEIYFFDKANNFRVCKFCPNCGRELSEE